MTFNDEYNRWKEKYMTEIKMPFYEFVMIMIAVATLVVVALK